VAKPNTVVLAESTRNLLGTLFELEDLGTQDLKGISGSVPAWAALRPASVESRLRPGSSMTVRPRSRVLKSRRQAAMVAQRSLLHLLADAIIDTGQRHVRR
jgi:hypothetical protein